MIISDKFTSEGHVQHHGVRPGAGAGDPAQPGGEGGGEVQEVSDRRLCRPAQGEGRLLQVLSDPRSPAQDESNSRQT